MMQRSQHIRQCFTILAAAGAFLCLTGLSAWAQNGDRPFHAVATDAKETQTDIKNVSFYWEEKVSETSFIPHELKHLPVKRGTATVNIKFDGIKQVEVKPGAEKALPTLFITLTNGKTGEFPLAIDGSFKGDSDFGQVEMPVHGLKKLEFK